MSWASFFLLSYFLSWAGGRAGGQPLPRQGQVSHHMESAVHRELFAAAEKFWPSVLNSSLNTSCSCDFGGDAVSHAALEALVQRLVVQADAGVAGSMKGSAAAALSAPTALCSAARQSAGAGLWADVRWWSSRRAVGRVAMRHQAPERAGGMGRAAFNPGRRLQ